MPVYKMAWMPVEYVEASKSKNELTGQQDGDSISLLSLSSMRERGETGGSSNTHANTSKPERLRIAFLDSDEPMAVTVIRNFNQSFLLFWRLFSFCSLRFPSFPYLAKLAHDPGRRSNDFGLRCLSTMARIREML